MIEVKTGDVVRMKSFTHVNPDSEFSFKAKKGNVAVFLLLGNEKLDGSAPLDPLAALDRLGWTSTALLLKYANHLNDCRYRGGHDCDCGLDEIRATYGEGKK